MSPYYNELPTVGIDDETAMAIVVVMLGLLAVVLLFCAIFWILRSISLYSIAKRRGIRKAWLAWLPIGNYWILGSIADQFQHLAQGKITSRRKIMLALSVAGAVVGFASGGISGMMNVMTEMESGAAGISVGLLSMVLSVLTWAVSIASLVFYHMCNYDLYRSCNPKNAVVFLVLGIVLGITEPFFYLACRKKDLGMPQPEPEAVPAEPAELPQYGAEF